MSHLSETDRFQIEAMLNQNKSLKSIAKELNRPTSTISREIKNHLFSKEYPLSDLSKKGCKNAGDCSHYQLCSAKCRLKCSNCQRCIRYCPDYEPDFCQTLTGPPYVCNGCDYTQHCRRNKVYYNAKKATNTYRATLHECRSGFNISDEQIKQLDALISPLIMQGLSPYHVAQTIRKELPVSESTIYRMVSSTQLSARNIDLINKVKRKPRKYPNHQKKSEIDSIIKDGHQYKDFLKFQEENDYPVVEMDCVEGTKEDLAVLLTLHFVDSHMQLAFIMDEHKSENVVRTLDMMEETLGIELFQTVCPLIRPITDMNFLIEKDWSVPVWIQPSKEPQYSTVSQTDPMRKVIVRRITLTFDM